MAQIVEVINSCHYHARVAVMTDSPVARRQSRIVSRLLELSTLMTARFEQVAAEHGLTPAQASAVLALGEPAPMSELAATLRCDASNVTGLADRLAAQGLLTRVEREGDRRVKLLALTSAGGRVRRSLREELLADRSGIATLSASEQHALLGLLDRVATAMADADR